MHDKLKTGTIKNVLSDAAKELQPKKIVCEENRCLGRFEAEVLLAHILKKPRTWLHSHSDYGLRTTDYGLFSSLVERRKKHEPVAYILGEKEFYGLPFFADKRALIPRPESEMLVELALNNTKSKMRNAKCEQAFIWDVGTGSGAVGISIAKKLPKARVLATDISAPALALAQKNAKRLKTKNITFLKADLLSPSVLRFLKNCELSTEHCELFITANLPYLPTSDKAKLDSDIVKYEPSSALFAGKDGLKIIKNFLRQLATTRLPFSNLFLEYDPPQTKKLRTLAKSLFPKANIQVHKDLAGRDRVMAITPLSFRPER
ncbi:MAG: peptide chain release factor N(5)-glutamine methyltransferase [Patescibacteria group bacterium]